MSDQPTYTITTDPKMLRGVLTIVKRAAMSDLEELAIEMIFANWFAELADQQKQLAALARINELAKTVPPDAPDQSPAATTPGDVSIDVLMTPEEAAAMLATMGGATEAPGLWSNEPPAADQHTQESPLDVTSGLVSDQPS